jgi:hypothetical protein
LESFSSANLLLFVLEYVVGHNIAQGLAAVLPMALGGYLKLLFALRINPRAYGFLHDESPL